MDTLINSCSVALNSQPGLNILVDYSHLIPAIVMMVLGFFILFKTDFSILSKIFLVFILFFATWLLGDVFIWTYGNYNVVSFSWSLLDYINILFYLFGAYFFAVLITGKDIPIWGKLGLLVVSLPAWFITASSQSITAFYEPWCEAFNNDILTNYKLAVELAVVAFIVIFGIYHFIKSEAIKRRQIVIVGLALILFFATFSVTEYISSETGIYEINLYSLFILPLFLAMIIYAIINLKIFNLRFFGMQLLVYILLIMIGSQFFFLEDVTNKALAILTFILSLTFAYFLIRTIRHEEKTRSQIELLTEELKTANGDLAKTNIKLKQLDQAKSEFISIASHQLRTPLTVIKGYISMMLEGSFGVLTSSETDSLHKVYESNQRLINLVEDLLNISRIESGRIQFNWSVSRLEDMMASVTEELHQNAQKKKLKLEFTPPPAPLTPVKMDADKLRQVFMNLVDNAIKYTDQGGIRIAISEEQGMVTVKVSDSGMGIDPDDMPNLFQKFSRGKGMSLVHTEGTGLGLYVAREMVNAHGGKIWAESAGKGKGSVFIVSLPVTKEPITPPVTLPAAPTAAPATTAPLRPAAKKVVKK